MKVGTRSLLFGVHQVFIHPWFVAAGWIKLYGWTWDLRIWAAFVVHDWGYWGKPNMDGPEGETHPVLGADIMWLLFGNEWRRFALLHSRFYAKSWGVPPSKLCYADKMAIVMTPWWVYLPLARLSGELNEYMTRGKDPHGKYAGEGQVSDNAKEWYLKVQSFVASWIDTHFQEASS